MAELTQEEKAYFAATRAFLLGGGKAPKGHKYEGKTLEEARLWEREQEEKALQEANELRALMVEESAAPVRELLDTVESGKPCSDC